MPTDSIRADFNPKTINDVKYYQQNFSKLENMDLMKEKLPNGKFFIKRKIRNFDRLLKESFQKDRRISQDLQKSFKNEQNLTLNCLKISKGEFSVDVQEQLLRKKIKNSLKKKICQFENFLKKNHNKKNWKMKKQKENVPVLNFKTLMNQFFQEDFHATQFKETKKLRDSVPIDPYKKVTGGKLFNTYNKFWISKKTKQQEKKIPLIKKQILDKESILKWSKSSVQSTKVYQQSSARQTFMGDLYSSATKNF